MKKSRSYFVFSILIIVFVISIVNKEFQNDTFFTIAIGENTIQNGISEQEQLTWHENLKFTNPRWAFDVTIATIYNMFGFYGIYTFVLIISSLIALSLFNILLYKKNNTLISFILVLAVMYFSKDALSARAQIISYLMFVLEIFFIEKILETQQKRYSALLVVNSIIVANFHASVWPFYLILFLPYLAEQLCIKMNINIFTEKVILKKEKSKLLIVTFIIIVLSGLCTPIGLTPYTYMLKNMSGISKNYIVELAPVVIIGNLGGFVMIATYGIVLFSNKAKIRLSSLLMILGLMVMGLMARRNMIFFYLISIIFFIDPFKCILNEETMQEIEETFNRKKYLSIISILMIILSGSLIFEKYNQDFVNKSTYPIDASEYILENIDISKMKIYNDFNYGSYLEYKKIPVFMDSRSEMYCKEFNETTIMEDYAKIKFGKENYERTFEKYGITHVLLKKDEIMAQYIVMDKNYRTLYEDENFVLYEKI